MTDLGADRNDSSRPETASVACLNCGASLGGSYCSSCGQSNAGRRLDTRALLGNILDHVLDLEAALPRTIGKLSLNPGKVAREYASGKRRRYVNPFKYAITLTALYLLVTRWLGIAPTKLFGSAIRVTTEGPGSDAYAVQTFIIGHVNAVIFLALPLFAMVLRWVFRTKGRNFPETYAMVLFVQGQVFLFQILLTVLGHDRSLPAAGLLLMRL